jgi:carboxyl-terminal processing protease
VVIGERTWGKGSVQNIVELEDGKSALKLTTAGYLRPSGKNIHRFDGVKENEDWGVSPNDDFEVKLTDEEMTQLITQRRKRDAILARQETSEAVQPVADRQLQKAVDYLKQQLSQPATEASDKQENEN